MRFLILKIFLQKMASAWKRGSEEGPLNAYGQDRFIST